MGTPTEYKFGINCTALDQSKLSNFAECTISNSNWTEWSTIQGVIGRVISKFRFEIRSTITP